MKKKIIGIVVCMLLMTTSVLAMGVIDTNKTEVVKENIRNFQDGDKPEPTQACGTVWIILTGNESCMIGAIIKLKAAFALMLGGFGITIPLTTSVQANVEQINIPEHPFNGSYGCHFDVCGFFRVVYIPPDGSNCHAKYQPYVVLRPDEEVDIYVVLGIEE